MNFPSEKLRNYVCLHNVQAVFVVSDSVDWGRDIQVVFVSNPLQCLQLSIKFHPTLYLFMAYLQSLIHLQILCDILRTGGLPGGEIKSQPPLYFAHDDLKYQVSFPRPQSCVNHLLQSLFTVNVFTEIRVHSLLNVLAWAHLGLLYNLSSTGMDDKCFVGENHRGYNCSFH